MLRLTWTMAEIGTDWSVVQSFILEDECERHPPATATPNAPQIKPASVFRAPCISRKHTPRLRCSCRCLPQASDVAWAAGDLVFGRPSGAAVSRAGSAWRPD